MPANVLCFRCERLKRCMVARSGSSLLRSGHDMPIAIVQVLVDAAIWASDRLRVITIEPIFLAIQDSLERPHPPHRLNKAFHAKGCGDASTQELATLTRVLLD